MGDGGAVFFTVRSFFFCLRQSEGLILPGIKIKPPKVFLRFKDFFFNGGLQLMFRRTCGSPPVLAGFVQVCKRVAGSLLDLKS